jgi:hypothetical protein
MLGIDVTSLAYDLATDPNLPADAYADSVPDKEQRVLAVGGEWVADTIGDPSGFTWRRSGGHIPVDVLMRAFTFTELCRIWMAEPVQSRLSDYIEKAHPLLEKIRLSIWHHGSGRNYNTFARASSGLARLTWPGAEVRLVCTGKYRCDGPVENVPRGTNLWLDNYFGALIYVGGKHMLTVAFGIGERGIHLTQCQLREKKGNRFLYRLPAHYLDVAIDMLTHAFPDEPLWIVDGASATAAVRRSYGKAECSMTPADEARIAELYDRPLARYDRSATDTASSEGRFYARLVATKHARLAA